MTSYELLSLLISLLAGVIAFVALYRTHRVAQRQLKLQETQVELQKEQSALARLQRQQIEERQKLQSVADVGIYIAQSVDGHRFFLRNLGPATACGVNVWVDSIRTGKSVLVAGDAQSKLPRAKLFPRDEIPLISAITMDTGNTFIARLRWQNESGDVTTKEVELAI